MSDKDRLEELRRELHEIYKSGAFDEERTQEIVDEINEISERLAGNPRNYRPDHA